MEVFIPNKVDLLELWFEDVGNNWIFLYKAIRDYSDDEVNSSVWISFIKNQFSLTYWIWDIRTRNFNPKSIEDLKILITIFSNNK